LVGDKLVKWNELVRKTAFVQLDDQPDIIKWNLSKTRFIRSKIHVYIFNQSNCLASEQVSFEIETNP